MTRMTLEELRRRRGELRRRIYLREGEFRGRVTVHMGTCGIAAGARDVLSALLDAMEAHAIRDIMLTTSGCAGLCSSEPMATVELRDQPPVRYGKLTAETAGRIFTEHVIGGAVVSELALGIGSERGA